MKKIIKIISSVLAILLLIIIITPFILAKVFDPNDYKSEISALVQEKTGRQLTITGDLNYSVFPWLGLNIGELQLSNSSAPGFSKAAFAKIKAAEVRVKIVPLFSAEIEVDKIVLDGLALSLQKNKQGVGNWQDLLAKKPKETASAQTPDKAEANSDTSEPTKKAATDSSAEPSIPLIFPAIAGIEVKNANIQWHDQQLDQKFDLNDFNFKTGVIANNTPTNLDITFRFKINKPVISGKSQISAKLKFDINKRSILVRDFEIKQELDQKFVKPETIELQLNISQIKADLKKQTASLTKLKVSVLDIELGGSFKAKNILSEVTVSGNLSSNEFSPKKIINTLGITLPKMADNKAFDKAKLELKVNANTKMVSVPNIIVTLDETKLKGKLSLANFAKPQIRYQFTMNEIDVDRYLPPVDKDAAKKKTADKKPANTKAGTAKAKATTEAEDIPIPIPSELLRTLDIKGSFSLGKLKVSNLKMKKLQFNVEAKNGIIRAKPISANLYKGSIKASLVLNVTKDLPVVNIQQAVSNISFKPMVIDLFKDEYLSGVGNVSANITTKGLTVAQFTKNLNGTASFNIKNSKLKYLNPIYLIKKGLYKKFKKEFSEEESFDKRKVFTVMKGSLKIKDGIATNNDFITESRDVNLNGKGVVNLVAQTIKYDANFILLKDFNTSDTKVNKILTNKPIPVIIRGPFSNISVDVKLDDVLSQIVKNEIKKKVDFEKKKLEQQAKDKLEAEKKKALEDAKKRAEKDIKNRLGDLFK